MRLRDKEIEIERQRDRQTDRQIGKKASPDLDIFRRNEVQVIF